MRWPNCGRTASSQRTLKPAVAEDMTYGLRTVATGSVTVGRARRADRDQRDRNGGPDSKTTISVELPPTGSCPTFDLLTGANYSDIISRMDLGNLADRVCA